MFNKIKNFLSYTLLGIASFLPSAVHAHAGEYHEPTTSVETSTALGLGLVFVVLLVALIGGLIIFSLVFWIMMLLHISKNDIPDKETWLIILIVSFFLSMPLVGAAAYYFVVKRNFAPVNSSLPEKKSKSPRTKKKSKAR